MWSGLLVGGIIAAIGVALFYLGGKYALMSGFDWLQMGGVFLIAVGGMLMFSGDITRESAIEWIKSLGFAIGVALLIRWPIAEPFRIPSGSMEQTLHGDERLGRGDRVFVNKWIYGVRYPFMNKRIWYGEAPKRWDIVVFKAVEPDAQHPTLVKRIVGMPGERISIHDGRVHRVFKKGEEAGIPKPEDAPDLDFSAAVELPRGQQEPELHIPLKLPENMQPVRYTSPGYASRDLRQLAHINDMKYGIRPEDEYALIPEGHYLLLGDNSPNSRDGRYWGWVPNENLVGRVASIWWPPQRWRDFTGFSTTLWWRALLAALGIFLFVRLLIGRSFAVHAHDGRIEHLYVDFLGLGLRLPFTRIWLAKWGRLDRGNAVLYWASVPGSDAPLLLVGRIAGLPGEKVFIENATLQINDRPVEGPSCLTGPRFTFDAPEAQFGRLKKKQNTQVPDGHCFVLAEHDDDSSPIDSRSVGWVPRNALMGRPRLVWWPLARCRKLS